MSGNKGALPVVPDIDIFKKGEDIMKNEENTVDLKEENKLPEKTAAKKLTDEQMEGVTGGTRIEVKSAEYYRMFESGKDLV